MIQPCGKIKKKKKQKKSKNADSSISFHQRKCQGGRKSIPKANLIIFENRTRAMRYVFTPCDQRYKRVKLFFT